MSEQKILILDEDQTIYQSLSDKLSRDNISCSFFSDYPEALKEMEKEHFPVLLINYSLPGQDGLQFLIELLGKRGYDQYKIIFITDHHDQALSERLFEYGCFDYLIKPFNLENLIIKIKWAIKELQTEISDKLSLFQSDDDLFIGESAIIKQVFRTIRQVADKDVNILLEGETGTGKELIAKRIYQTSTRSSKPFIPINCGALTESLLESELFGYEKGAFTDAFIKKAGILETADKGTIFLDEINSASFNAQIKLLRFMETGEFMRVGSNKIYHADVRIIAASNQNLEKMVKGKKFREDLYHRLNVVKISLPPLYQRKTDIPILIRYFLNYYNNKYKKHISIPPYTLPLLLKYRWPGNIRQLKNVIQSLVLLCEHKTILPGNIPEVIRKNQLPFDQEQFFPNIKKKTLEEFEVDYLVNLLDQFKGNVSKISRQIKLSRTNLIKKLKKYLLYPRNYKLQ